MPRARYHSPPSTGGVHPSDGPAAGGLASQAFALTLDDPLASRPSQFQVDEDEDTMEELFREILIPVPSAPETAATPNQVVKEELNGVTTPTKANGNSAQMDPDVDESSSVDWAGELDMQRLLDSLQQQHTSTTALATSGLELFSWNDVQGTDTLSVMAADVF